MKTVLEYVKTKDRSVELIDLLDDALNSKFSKNVYAKLGDLPINLDKKSEALDQIQKAKEDLLSANILDLTMYIEPDETFISKLYTWFQNNGFKNFLLNIHIDPSIYGGLLLSYNGRYVDLSLKKKVEEYVTK